MVLDREHKHNVICDVLDDINEPEVPNLEEVKETDVEEYKDDEDSRLPGQLGVG